MPANKDETIKVTVIVDHHTHAGKECAKGDVIEVSHATAKWLAENNVIATTKAGTAKKED